MAIHTHMRASQVEIIPGLYFATESQHLEWLVQQAEGKMRFFVGYAGWTGGQLEKELEGG
jgi:putative transcriptional regulator